MAQLPLNKRALAKRVIDACRADDVSLIARCIETAALPESDVTVDEILDQSLRRSLALKAIKVLSYVLQQGANVHELPAESIFDRVGEEATPSREVLEKLVAHGWDINSCGDDSSDKPLLWLVIRNHGLVEWCLERGASVQHSDFASHPDPILERAAVGSNIATFELLRSKGAAITFQVLPRAVQSAAVNSPRGHLSNEDDDPIYREHLAMVRHLIEVLGLDVNEYSQWPGNSCSNPLYCVACWAKGNTKTLVRLLLDHGATLDISGYPGSRYYSNVLEAASERKNVSFIQAVDQWQASHGDGTSLEM